MFVYCFSEELKNRLEEEQHRFIFEGKNEYGPFWVFQLVGPFTFADSEKESREYIITKRLSFNGVVK